MVISVDHKNLPKTISIILPVRNEENYIAACLTNIFSQKNFNSEMEVIIADGMSTDNTRDIVKEFQKQHSNLILIDNPAKIVPTAMNKALAIARGDIIIRVDGHCEITPFYVSNCVKHLIETSADGVGGPMQTIGETHLSETIAIAMGSVFGVGNSAFRTSQGKTMFVDSVPFPAYTRQIIEKIGLYDEELIRNQDDEYNYRIREAGGMLLLAADVQSRYYSRGSLTKLWKQYFQYGYWKVRVLQKHPRQMSLRQFVPPAFVASLILSFALALFFQLFWFIFLGISGSYLLANLLASFLIAAKKGWQYLMLLPLVFAILHISYGLGFLVGSVRFANRWNDKIGKVPPGLPFQT
jgi:glycosyltransferase involved in cell wall biosynthesis